MGGIAPARIVIINDRSTRMGGATNLAILSAELLRRRGLLVTFFAGDDEPGDRPAEDMINLGEAPLLDRRRSDALRLGLYNPKAYGALSRLISTRDTPTTIYHVHGWSKILSPAIFRALAKVRERVVLHAHDYFLACPNGGFVNYRTQRVCDLEPMSRRCLTTQCDKRGLNEKLWRTARHLLREHLFPIRSTPAQIVIVHEKMRDYMLRAGIGDERLETIRNPVSPLAGPGLAPWTRENFVFIGRLEEEKGYKDAARAADLAGVPLHFIGDGAGRAFLDREFPGATVHGWKSKEAMHDIVSAARAVVVPSRVPEPFGLAALEAAGSGLPVIITNAALLSQEIAASGCGLSFTPANVDDLAAAMRRIASDDALVHRMSAAGVAAAPQLSHTPESWADALIDLYGRMLPRGRSDSGAPAPLPGPRATGSRSVHEQVR
ncbi:glycosyltransferase family 4 protein [Sinorhizobium americanum]|uniref:Glycosyltransferase n=1 Tax=Sinorhizobium americanum TaxID=194963 RepID=A0A1L3LX87_9HYPH|nr:glycosyltransferase family 4 protein [Sinorhizobium americanum]APG94688.1 glycosyltransferase [Sinorhizobium americanum]OAP48723.1 glycosyl transferase family 1 [Sinorhizobium americanum]